MSNLFINQLSKNRQCQEDVFSFLREGNREMPSFFSQKGLAQDIIKITAAEPDIQFEVFYAL